MTRVAVAVSIVLLAGCGASARRVQIAPALPPSPATWPPYPRFASASCWTRSTPGKPLRAAPSYAAAPTHRAPAQIAASILRTLGDRRYVQRVAFGPRPPLTRQHSGWFPHAQPPANALWAYIADPASVQQLEESSPARTKLTVQIAGWEGELVKGALRDEFCAAGAAPLVGWSVSGSIGNVSDSSQALEQRFPNPSPAVFRARVADVGKRYGFTVQSIRLLRPLQLAPLVMVRTARSRKAFVADVPAIMRLLDPIRSSRTGSAVTFEGFFFAAADENGPFVSVEDVYRGEVMGGQWSWSPCVYPYPHSEPLVIGRKNPCH